MNRAAFPPRPTRPLHPVRPPRPPRWSRRAWPSALLLAVLLAASGVTVQHLVEQRPAPRSAAGLPAANRRPPLLPPGPDAGPAALTVPAGPHAAPGSRLACPAGSKPGIMLTGVTFDPPLTGGTTLGVGTYRISLTAQITNETGAGLLVSGVSARVRGESWHPRVSRPDVVGPGSSARMTAAGTYRSRHAGPVRVATDLHWTWQNPALRACGVRGLIEDD